MIASSQVLAIHSYHPDFFWTQSLVEGIESGIKGHEITVEHTYLDSKRVQSDGYFENLKSLYQARLADHDYDAILTTDNAAMWLVGELADEIGDTPVIFSGLNTATSKIDYAVPRLTGVNEAIDIWDNIGLIKQANPDAERVWIVLDDSFSSRQYWTAIESQLASDTQGGVEIKRFHGLLFDELVEQIAQLDAGDVVLFVSYFKDASGTFMEHSDLLTAIQSKANVPIYGASSFMLLTA
ncbi:type 1 periplasmic-binding domain-containing protein [Enterovibrio coralii]|uniref:hypothetical protein n=1 Tax=Enterovibrio coralii TaxID=294935 RepID=UPI001E4B8F4A|nr:hypothetical protein [Enterovibrio coralii]